MYVNPAVGCAPRLIFKVAAGLEPQELPAVTESMPGILSKVSEMELVVLMPSQVAGNVKLYYAEGTLATQYVSTAFGHPAAFP